MKRRVAFAVGLIGLILVCASFVQAKSARIGIVYDGESERFPTARDLFFDEIRNMTRGVHTVSFPSDAQLSGNWNAQQDQHHKWKEPIHIKPQGRIPLWLESAASAPELAKNE